MRASTLTSSLESEDLLRQPPRAGWPTAMAVGWVGGVVLGSIFIHLGWWLILSCCLVVMTGQKAVQRHPTAVRYWALLAAMAVSAAWTVVSQHRVALYDVAQFIDEPAQLARVTGVVDSSPRIISPRRGEFGAFSHRGPTTVFVLAIDSMVIEEKERPVRGRLLARIQQADHRIRLGDRVRILGWLGTVRGPSNPGGLDYKRLLADRAIHGRIRVPASGNCEVVDRDALGPFRKLRQAAAGTAIAALRWGMKEDQRRLAFLEAILLGGRPSEFEPLYDQFRRAGVAHLLAISGAHLAILLGGVWFAVRCVVRNPSRAAIWVLVVLGLYLLAVPPRVPIVRASLMALVMGVGYATGRSLRPLDLLSVAVIAVLIWRPGDLFTAGFQLSFAVVTGLLLYTRSVSHWLWPPSPQAVVGGSGLVVQVARSFVTFVSVNLVASLVALPLVAYHFRIVCPWAAVASLVILPAVTAVLLLGYLKILFGLCLPSVSSLLVYPLAIGADLVMNGVQWISTWSISSIELQGEATVVGTLATLAVVAALLSGWFAGRRMAVATAVLLCTIQTMGLTGAMSQTVAGLWPGRSSDRLVLNMFSVSDGSCYVLRMKPDTTVISKPTILSTDHATNHTTARRDHVLMFDCGSQAYMNVGTSTVVPALQRLNIGPIDTLVISHADLDHYNGSLAVIDRVGVKRVWMSPQMLIRAKANPRSAVGFFLEQLRLRRVHVQTVSRGWHEVQGDAELEVLWPPPELAAAAVNDTSLVLSIRTGGRRVLLNGDIGQIAIQNLLAEGVDLRSDVCDLPHHGSFVPASPLWLEAVSPTVVLQSSGPGRLRNDKWAAVIDRSSIRRLISHTRGMVQLTIAEDGHVEWTAFK